MAADLEGGDLGFGLADQIKSLAPSHERCLMAAESVLNALETTAVNQTVLMACAAISTEGIGASGLSPRQSHISTPPL